MLFGATSSIIRGVKTPVLFSLVSGFQWFGISSVFYGMRVPWGGGRTTRRQPQRENHFLNFLLQAQENWP